MLLIAVAVFVLSIGLGNYLARAWRMPDYGWKLALIFFAFSASAVTLWLRWPPKLGVDLSGGVMMVYEIDQIEDAKDQKVDMGKLIEAVSRRVNPSGLKEVTIRPYGANQVEVIIPNVTKEEAKQVKDQISLRRHAGIPHSRQCRDHASLVKRALAEENLDRSGIPRAICWVGGCRWQRGHPGIAEDRENIRGSARTATARCGKCWWSMTITT